MSESRRTGSSTEASLRFTARWDRPLIPVDGGTANLLVTISLPRGGVLQRAPLDLAFVLDRSGSMANGKLELAKLATQVGIDQLGPADRVSVVTYDHEVETLHRLTPLDAGARARTSRVIRGITPRGSTDLGAGWMMGCEQLAADMRGNQTRVRRVLLLTDGQANVGITNPGELMRHAAALRQRGINTTTLGVGDDFDEYLLAGLTEAGGGNFQYIRHPGQLEDFFAEELGELLTVSSIGLKLVITLPHGVRATLVNFFPSNRNGKTIEILAGDLPQGRDLNLVFTCTMKNGIAGDRHPMSMAATWIQPDDGGAQTVPVTVPPLHVVERHDLARADIDLEVAEEVAHQIANAREREAMVLDREGRHAESRSLLQQHAASMHSAPASPRLAEMRSHFEQLADVDASAAFDSAIRKQSTSDAMRRSRGRQTPPDSASS